MLYLLGFYAHRELYAVTHFSTLDNSDYQYLKYRINQYTAVALYDTANFSVFLCEAHSSLERSEGKITICREIEQNLASPLFGCLFCTQCAPPCALLARHSTAQLLSTICYVT